MLILSYHFLFPINITYRCNEIVFGSPLLKIKNSFDATYISAAMVMTEMAMISPTFYVHVPFAYVIQDNEEIIFIGSIRDF